MKYLIVLALIAFTCTSTSAQEIDCTEEFFRVGRRDTGCQDFFVCMIGGRVDFSCDDGEIFDVDNVTCRAGDAETCEFAPETTTVSATRLESISVDSKYARQIEIIGDECENDFLRVAPHPNPERCFEFFVCMNYNLVQFECDAGFIFSEEQERCVRGNQRTCEPAGRNSFDKVMKLMKTLRKQ